MSKLTFKPVTSRMNRGSSVSIAPWLRAGRSEVRIPAKDEMFISSKTSTPALGLTQSPVSWGYSSQEVRLTTAELRNESFMELLLHSPYTPSRHEQRHFCHLQNAN
jgi:hypothetical protein